MNIDRKYFIHSHNRSFLDALSDKFGQPCLVLTHTPPVKSENIFDYRDLVFAEYPGVNWSKIEPIDGDILKKMGDCERIFLKMSDRLAPGMSYQQRKD
jgi:hypothetical protein